MKIGFFTDTYFPQVSGVATSIQTLKNELENRGHEVYIFTTTDPQAPEVEKDIIRMPSVPFVSFTDRRIVVRGMWYAYLIAKELELDLIHTHTEFGTGILGKMVGKKLRIPVIHTYHTMYEDYLHYIAKGKVVKPSHVKYFSRLFVNHSTGVVCPSKRVTDTLERYGTTTPMRIIPTGIDIQKFLRPDITPDMTQKLREDLGIAEDQLMLLSLSRLSYEKNIQALIKGFPKILAAFPQARLVVVGKGPYLEELEKLIADLNIEEFVQFVGEVDNAEVAYYYKAADYFISASHSETQGLTYIEAMSAGLQSVVMGNAYLEQLINHPTLGCTYETEEDFADCMIDYMQNNQGMDPIILKEKLYEISATCFGDSMLAFYQDMIEYHQQKLLVKEMTPPIDKIKVRFTSKFQEK
ncbi:1,2-diacylglycerol 3-alpha-glucosyltransferase [Enterococcus sp. PF1-24]|uniref:glycosyltransferase family 4 protein n=1 Tax=unclassified Enterococcus TaxID=2608891 RepID=UPI0024764A19|nr:MULTISPECIES: glycosyltransferase family 4 protein [unclassified Enterococcus]MDH6363636.1 1,2-diacylglycerol 3-alpha-glucosyltransferase [Enterococcus sp. PFB1-1]MDH6400871.1 1,2-diacylglycerol 3-alpha-glucosyltransferase [Enterococcus sp. PF1-24]